MPCYICNKKSQYYQRLDRSRIRFMRKVYPDFGENSYLCMRCFEKFEKIFKSKKKSKSTSTISVDSGATLKTVHSTASSKSSTDTSIVTRRNVSSKENTQSNSSPALKFLSHSFTAESDEESIDSTDRIVQKRVENRSLRDSSKVSRHADIVVAREGAQAAEKSALRRKRTREDVTPPQTPTGRRYSALVEVDEDDTSEIPSEIASNDLANVRPIVKRRKEPVVYLEKDVMDIYLANTSGG